MRRICAKVASCLGRACCLLLVAHAASAEVVRVEITRKDDAGTHERVIARVHYAIDPAAKRVIDSAPAAAEVTALLAAAVALIGGDRKEPMSRSETALRLLAQLPVLNAAIVRRNRGEEALPAPHGRLGHAARTLWMLTGRLPDPLEEGIMNSLMVVHLDHGIGNLGLDPVANRVGNRADEVGRVVAHRAFLFSV